MSKERKSKIRNEAAKSRRQFLKTGATAVAGAAALSMPQCGPRPGRTVFKFQSTWPPKDIFHEFAADFVARVNEMAGGRLKLELLAAGAVAKAFEVQDAVIAGTLDGGHGVTRLLVWQAQGLFAVRNAAGLGLARQPDDRLDEIWRRPGSLRRTGAAGARPRSRRLPYRTDADPAARLVQAGDHRRGTARRA